MPVFACVTQQHSSQHLRAGQKHINTLNMHECGRDKLHFHAVTTQETVQAQLQALAHPGLSGALMQLTRKAPLQRIPRSAAS